MSNRTLKQAVEDLRQSGQLLEIDVPIDPNLQAAEIQRRVYQAEGPAILYRRVVGSPFAMVSNLFGTIERTRYLFRHTLNAVRQLVTLKIDPQQAFKHPLKSMRSLPTARNMLPKKVRRGPVLSHLTSIDQLPQLTSWPDDGGPFITLPQVYTEDPNQPGLMNSNLGMYRIQLAGNEYQKNGEIGLHYQLHRGIGVHHAAAIQKGEPFRVNIFVGGHPAMTLAAVMPLPEGMSELMFAGALAGHRIEMISQPNRPAIYAQADFCITGTVEPNRLLPEGPFGDHLGYYSLAHDFPVLKVDAVYHRPDAIWPFTVVGRPPQEDTSFGKIIHEITGPIIPTVLPGVKEIHAVDAAGVHPLLLAIGSERYVPYAKQRIPQELLTTANAILGQGQLSLAKYLWIAAQEDEPALDCHDIPKFFQHILQRVDWKRDLHFQTRTTIDTLDYSGSGLNAGSKVVIAAAGPIRRELPREIPGDLSMPEAINKVRLVMPGVLVVSGLDYNPARLVHSDSCNQTDIFRKFASRSQTFTVSNTEDESRGLNCLTQLPDSHLVNQFPFIVVADDADFAVESLNNFLWVAFTRSNPAADLFGIGAFTEQKHWGCTGSLILDARIKPHHAPPLIEDPAVTKSVDQLAAPGGPLHGVI